MVLRLLQYHFIRIKRRRQRSRYIKKEPPYPHCKNCGHELHGQFCSVCGQHAFVTNQPLKDSFFSYLDTNYAFDRQLGHTLRDLFFKPGYLAREYMHGHIARHVHPFKLYFFASILLFGVMVPITQNYGSKEQLSDNKPLIDTMKVSKGGVHLGNDTEQHKEEPAIIFGSNSDSTSSSFDKKVEKKLTGMTQKELFQKFLSYLSISVLFLMPLFALLLMMLYRNRERYYIGHLILSIHQHSVLFFAISLSLIWKLLVSSKYTIGGWLSWAMLIYFVLSIAHFYNEKIFKSVLKAILLLFLYLIVCSIAIIIVVALTFLL